MALYLVIELPTKPANRWIEYNDAESRGTHAQIRGSLERFINALLDLPQPVWMEWAIAFCLQFEQKNLKLPIRSALFERVLFPSLQRAMQSRVPGSFRLLAGLFSKLENSESCMEGIPEELRSPEMLLREELRWHPDDMKAGLQLVDLFARYASHTLHELPTGVLYEMDGASIAQCDELLSFMHDFRETAIRFGVLENYKELIADGTFHYDAYKRYLETEDFSFGYAEFLRLQGP
jgi:hypothetical protein